MLASFPELLSWFKGKDGSNESRFFAFLITVICILAIILSGIYWLSYSKPKEEIEGGGNYEGRCSTCFSGVKNLKIPKLHIFLFLIKRFLSSAIILLIDWSVNIKITIFIILLL